MIVVTFDIKNGIFHVHMVWHVMLRITKTLYKFLMIIKRFRAIDQHMA